MRPDCKTTLKASSIRTKNSSGAAFNNSAVKPLSSDDFLIFKRLIAKRNFSSVQGGSRTVGAACMIAKGPTNNPSNIDANSSFVGCCMHCCPDGPKLGWLILFRVGRWVTEMCMFKKKLFGRQQTEQCVCVHCTFIPFHRTTFFSTNRYIPLLCR